MQTWQRNGTQSRYERRLRVRLGVDLGLRERSEPACLRRSGTSVPDWQQAERDDRVPTERV